MTTPLRSGYHARRDLVYHRLVPPNVTTPQLRLQVCPPLLVTAAFAYSSSHSHNGDCAPAASTLFFGSCAVGLVGLAPIRLSCASWPCLPPHRADQRHHAPRWARLCLSPPHLLSRTHTATTASAHPSREYVAGVSSVRRRSRGLAPIEPSCMACPSLPPPRTGKRRHAPQLRLPLLVNTAATASTRRVARASSIF